MSDSIKILHFTDVHLLDHNPPSRLGSYRQDIMDKLRRIGDIGRDAKVDAYTCGGDWFHEKPPAKTSHSMVFELMSILKSYGAQCYTILGNHDIRFDRSNTYPEQPIGPLLNSGAVMFQNGTILHSSPIKPTVMLHGFDFSEQPDLDAISLKSEDRGQADFHVLSLHVYSSMVGGTLWGKTKCFSYKELLGLGYDVVLLGHYHADQGLEVLTREDGSTCLFVNVGSLSRGDYGDENLTRIPKCCVVSFSKREGVTAEEIPVGAKPASEVFDLAEKAEIKEKEKQASEFVEKLKSSEVVTSSGEDPVSALSSLNIDDDAVVAKTREFLTRAIQATRGVLS